MLKEFTPLRACIRYWPSFLADAIAMHWALTSDDSWAQDGKDVYAIAGTVSAYVHLWTGC